MMLENLQVTEENWRDALAPNRADSRPSALEGFARSESPRHVGRAIAALAAADPDRAQWNQMSGSSAELARAYGFTDIDGSQPDSRGTH
jgi:hypothetical protein